MTLLDRRRFIASGSVLLGGVPLPGRAAACGATLDQAPVAQPRFTLTSAEAADAAPFCLGYSFRQGEIALGKVIGCDLPAFQASVRNRWPDGSVKFAVLAGRVSLAQGEARTLLIRAVQAPLAEAVLGEADLQSTQLSAILSFEPHGEVELASLIGVPGSYDPSIGRWKGGKVRELVAGPQMSSWLYYAPIGTSAHLAAWFEVRCWAGGHVEVLPWLENGWLNVAGPTSHDGTLRFAMNGTERFSQALTLAHHCRVVAVRGRPAGHWAPHPSPVRYLHDGAYLQHTHLVPTYMVRASAGVTARQAAMVEPLARARFPAGMGSGGYDPSIGLLPEWDVSYLVGDDAPRALDAVLVQGFAAGRYAIHYRDERTNQPLRFSSHADLCFTQAPGLGVSATGTSSKNVYTPAHTGATPPNWVTSHHPSVGYLAYLTSGWFYFAEEAQFSATVGFLKQTNVARGGARGLLLPNVGANTTRGAAWSLRTLLQAAVVTPDADAPLHQEFLSSIASNVDDYHRRYVERSNNPFGVCAPYSSYRRREGVFRHAMWMEDFLTAAWGYALSLELPLPEPTLARLKAFFEWKARSIIGRLGRAGVEAEYNHVDAAQYTVAVAPSTEADFKTGKGPWYSDWGAIYAATLGKANSDAGTDSLRGAYFPDPTSYWGNLQPAIAYAVEHGVPGADEAYRRMTSARNWQLFIEKCSEHPVWAVGLMRCRQPLDR